VFETRFPFVQLLPQATTEALLERRVLELGVDIRRGHLVETVEQCEDGVLIAGRKGQVPFVFLQAMPSALMELGASCGVRPTSIFPAIRHDMR
jgi:hypothetical protein